MYLLIITAYSHIQVNQCVELSAPLVNQLQSVSTSLDTQGTVVHQFTFIMFGSQKQSFVLFYVSTYTRQYAINFLKVCTITCVFVLFRYVSHHLYGTMDEHNTLDIFCQKELMGKDHSLEFVLKTRWRSKEPPLQLEYRERVDVI